MSYYNICQEYINSFNIKYKKLIDDYNNNNKIDNINKIISSLIQFESILVSVKLRNFDRFLLNQYYLTFQNICEFYIRHEFYRIDNNIPNLYFYKKYINDILENNIDLTDIIYSLDKYLEVYIDNNIN